MGAVYEAIDQRVSCMVALKETLVGSSPEARQAFQREAALLANLRQAALPKVMDYFGEGEGEFLVMEFIQGHDLAELLALRDGPFPQEQADPNLANRKIATGRAGLALENINDGCRDLTFLEFQIG
jgi:serine/threonine protein kinase